MKTSLTRPVMALFAMLALVLGSPHALSAEPTGQPAKAKAKTKTATDARKGQVGRVTFLRGSEETTGERSARLKRECKGGVNAGACAGYTR
jgi:NAD(P)H-hydrate repair Nnr-like enzyme with NAD(P)H-hydrate dehydratase domain